MLRQRKVLDRGMSGKPMMRTTSLFRKKAMVLWGLVVVAAVVTVVYMFLPSVADVGGYEETDVTIKKVHPKKGMRSDSGRVSAGVEQSKASGAGDVNLQDAQEDLIVASDESVVIGPEEEERQALSEPDLNPSAMDDLRDIFSQLSADDSADEGRLMQALSCYKPSAILGAAGNILKFGTSEEKGQALYAVGMFFGKEGCTGVPYEVTHPKNEIAIGDDGSESVAPTAERPTQQLISTVFAGLSDEDESVRDVAFSVMRSLPDEESGVLTANLLSDGDAGLQERLMREAGDESDLRLSLMGMGCDNQSVRSLAVENLKNASGREFANQQEASEWYEAYYREFQQGAGSQSPKTGGKIQQGQNQ